MWCQLHVQVHALHVQYAPQLNTSQGVVKASFRCISESSLVSPVQNFSEAGGPHANTIAPSPLLRAPCTTHQWLSQQHAPTHGCYRHSNFHHCALSSLACSLVRMKIGANACNCTCTARTICSSGQLLSTVHCNPREDAPLYQVGCRKLKI